ncbi:hypothetical protein DPMN_084386 [Dreissena polymorpha]|uniref:Uncharacterized protein n=1 Tax=Dreissena polymorpha TaxID=45954 RepID=A0A9D3YAN4_DREPO|nr:hypothetical protein DPMN_084386 [Dreissena polymorpha]
MESPIKLPRKFFVNGRGAPVKLPLGFIENGSLTGSPVKPPRGIHQTSHGSLMEMGIWRVPP